MFTKGDIVTWGSHADWYIIVQVNAPYDYQVQGLAPVVDGSQLGAFDTDQELTWVTVSEIDGEEPVRFGGTGRHQMDCDNVSSVISDMCADGWMDVTVAERLVDSLNVHLTRFPITMPHGDETRDFTVRVSVNGPRNQLEGAFSDLQEQIADLSGAELNNCETEIVSVDTRF
jgi:hypothetical protein